jgi:hypothetical protein
MSRDHYEIALLLGLVTASLTCILYSCEKAPQPGLSGPAGLEVYLGDSPAHCRAIWIHIRKLMFHISGRDTGADNGWIEAPLVRTGKYNLLAPGPGRDARVAEAKLPLGTIDRIRLILGRGNEIVFNDGSSSPLHIPPFLQPGIDIPMHAVLTAKTSFALVLEIDAGRSVHQAAGYVLDPVIRTYPRGTGGSLAGVVLPSDTTVKVLAIRGADTAGTVAGNSGGYLLCGLDAGEYSLIFLPSRHSGLKSDTVFHISVRAGRTTTMDTVRLHAKPEGGTVYPVPLSSGLQIPL